VTKTHSRPAARTAARTAARPAARSATRSAARRPRAQTVQKASRLGLPTKTKTQEQLTRTINYYRAKKQGQKGKSKK
jgi:hypothetical protein